MARIRSVKPELRTSLVVAQWPREVRYFWVLLWGYLDDYGRGVDEERLIKSDCFPVEEDLTPADINSWLDMIASAGPLCRYQVAGKRYLHAPNWSEHQRPSHPSTSRMPPCPLHDPTVTTPEALASDAGGAPEALVPEQLVRAGSREQGAGSTVVEARTRAKADRGTRLADDFAISDELMSWAREHVPALNTAAETEKFRDYWRSTARNATKRDWAAAWRNWMRTAAERLPQARASPNGNRASTTDQRVNQALEVGRRLQAVEDAKRQSELTA